ncbi:methyltransferase domain-containing protein [Chloroflexota bacterium]
MVTPNPWELILSRPYLNEMAREFGEAGKRGRWCRATFEGGNTLRLWNEAVELKLALLSACSPQKGQQIALLGKYTGESGLAPALSSLVGQKGSLVVEEILPTAMAALEEAGSAHNAQLQWDYDYLDSFAKKSLDRVVLFNAASHVKNWQTFAQQIDRVLADDGRLIIAEAPWGSREMMDLARLDAHLYGVLAAVLDGMGIEEDQLRQTGPDDLKAIFQPFLSWNRSFNSRGLYLYYGQKGSADTGPTYDFPALTPEVSAFLAERPCNSPWDFLSPAEASILGSEVTDESQQKGFWRFASFGAGLDWLYLKYEGIVRLMYENLRAKPGFRVLVIGEVLENLGFLPELRRRIGDSGKIADFEISNIHLTLFQKLWQGTDIPVEERHQWEYNFQDAFPDNYFDLVWLPQGVHHARNWPETAPRLLRVLKPGGQVMMLECRFCTPGFHIAVNASGLLRCMAEKLWWAMGVTLDEMPDYPTAQLAEAFGDSLTDTFGLDSEGWLLYWGFKK